MVVVSGANLGCSLMPLGLKPVVVVAVVVVGLLLLLLLSISIQCRMKHRHGVFLDTLLVHHASELQLSCSVCMDVFRYVCIFEGLGSKI